MKKQLLLCLAIILALMGLQAQEEKKDILENPAITPGKTVKLTETLRITDEEGDFYFKAPEKVRVAPDQSLFVQDESRLLKFDPNGKFVKNLVKQGEGPGEVKYISDYFIQKDGITIGTARPTKLLLMNHDGALGREFRLKGNSGLSFFVGRSEKEFYFYTREFDFAKARTGVSEQKISFFHSDPEGNVTKWDLPVSTRIAMLKRTSKNRSFIAMDYIERLLIASDEPTVMYMAHTERYLLKKLDLKTKTFTLMFRRSYKPAVFTQRPRPPREDGQPRPAGPQDQYDREYYNDIYKLAMYKGRLWVITSTFEKGKGFVVDVFDKTGKLVDCFYMLLPGVTRPDTLIDRPLIISGDFLYTIEPDEEDTPTVVKYKISF